MPETQTGRRLRRAGWPTGNWDLEIGLRYNRVKMNAGEVGGDLADIATAVFDAAGALSVTVVDAGAEPLLEPAPGETPLWADTRVTALFEPAIDPARVASVATAAR